MEGGAEVQLLPKSLCNFCFTNDTISYNPTFKLKKQTLTSNVERSCCKLVESYSITLVLAPFKAKMSKPRKHIHHFPVLKDITLSRDQLP